MSALFSWLRGSLFATLLGVSMLAVAAHAAQAADPPLTVYVVRHGQTDWNREGRIQGGTDNPLNATGQEQAAALARTLADVRIDAVYTSSHQRARQTAAALEPRAKVTELDGLRERFFGKFEGANDKDPAIVADWNARRFTWNDELDGGESLESQTRRAAQAWERIRALHPAGGSIVIVGHGGINPVLLSLMLGLPPQDTAKAINQGNDEIYRVELPPGGSASIWKLIPRNKLAEL